MQYLGPVLNGSILKCDHDRFVIAFVMLLHQLSRLKSRSAKAGLRIDGGEVILVAQPFEILPQLCCFPRFGDSLRSASQEPIDARKQDWGNFRSRRYFAS